MSKPKSVRIADHFAELTDPRRREVVYPLINVVVIAVCAVICGADDFVAIAEFGRTKREWLARFLDLESGIPSHDRFNAIFAAIKPAEFEKCLLSWITALHEITDGQVVAIDGKTLRRSFDTATGKAAIHMVTPGPRPITSAWARSSWTPRATRSRPSRNCWKSSNFGCMVTIDAMGCQTEIAEANRRRRTRIIAGRERSTSRRCIRGSSTSSTITWRTTSRASGCVATRPTKKGHGREETRYYMICPVPDDLPDRSRWTGLKAIGVAISDYDRAMAKKVGEVRYYILSKYRRHSRFADAVRGHWGIENRLHWQLDVTFQEDQCRIRKGHADANFSILRRTALSQCSRTRPQLKVGIKNKRLTAGWDESYLEKVLFGT